MARNKKNNSFSKKHKIIGSLVFLFALLLLVSLISHRHFDDIRISSEVDRQINPFDIQYRNQGGMLGAYISYCCFILFGWLSFFIPLGLILLSLRLFSSILAERLKLNSPILFTIAVLGTMIYNIHLLIPRQLGIDIGAAGGFITEKLTIIFIKLVGELGSYILLSGIIIILLILYISMTPLLSINLSLPGIKIFYKCYNLLKTYLMKLLSFNWLSSFFESKKGSNEIEEDESSENYPPEPQKVPVHLNEITNQSPLENTRKNKPDKRKSILVKQAETVQIKSISYTYPDLSLLKENPFKGSSVDNEELNFTARMLRETLQTFGISIDGAIDKYPGPIITRFEFKPGSGIKVNQITNLSDDLALALKAKRIRIIAPIPGKAAVGVEIPNRSPQMVFLKDIIKSSQYRNADFRLPLALGKTTSGKPFVADLAKMPHLLIAGATGSGKSVGMNIMITSLIYRLHPHRLRFILIDPKMLELTVYTGIPHLARPVVTKPRRAEKVLSDAVVEMESRYRKLANASVRNIEDYNNKQEIEENKIPYVIICVDELADLMISTTSSKTEMLITRLAQMSRAVGIHLILATQRPSVDVITGLIKANFPARIAFQVSSKVDSRTIIDANGAEKLLGFGDMLFLQTGQPEPIRIHGPFISNEETDTIIKFIKDQGLEMMSLERISQAKGETTENEIDFGDPLFREACEVVIRHKQGSVSLLQRRLGIGYQRAARLIDKLENAGIVSPFDGSKARDVLVDKTYLETIFTNAEKAPQMNTEKN